MHQIGRDLSRGRQRLLRPPGIIVITAFVIAIGVRAATVASAIMQRAPDAGPELTDWPAYGRDPGGARFSPLQAIRRESVSTLQVAWTYNTGDAYEPKQGRPTAFEATPLYVDGMLYLSTPAGRIIALDPVSGRELWVFDSRTPRD